MHGPGCFCRRSNTMSFCAGAVRHLTAFVTYVLPVSDDGGSTAEIVRVLGGPAVGDIRSRCLRLADDSDEEVRAVKLFSSVCAQRRAVLRSNTSFVN